jgi:hypothetical protein
MVLPCFLLGRPVSQSDKGLALMDRSRRLASSWRLGEWEQQAWDLDALSRSSGRPLTAALPAQARLAWERPGRFSRSAVLPQNQARSYIRGGWQQATDLRSRDWGEPREGCGEALAPIRDT